MMCVFWFVFFDYTAMYLKKCIEHNFYLNDIYKKNRREDA